MEVRLAEVRPAEVRLAEVRPVEVRPAEVRLVEVRPAEIWGHATVFPPPAIPDLDALLRMARSSGLAMAPTLPLLTPLLEPRYCPHVTMPDKIRYLAPSGWPKRSDPRLPGPHRQGGCHPACHSRVPSAGGFPRGVRSTKGVARSGSLAAASGRAIEGVCRHFKTKSPPQMRDSTLRFRRGGTLGDGPVPFRPVWLSAQ